MNFIVFALFLLLSFASKSALAFSWYAGISPQDTATQSTSLSIGMLGEQWGGGMSVILNSQYSDKDFTDTQIPHSDYQDLGTKRINTTTGFDVYRMFDVGEDWPILFVEGSLYFGRKSRIVKSNVTGWLWAQDKTSVTLPGMGAGVFIGRGSPSFGIEYHSIRGLTLLFKKDFQ